MQTQNVTLSIPKPVLLKAKRLALERGMSLSGLLTQTLHDIVEAEDEYERAHTRHLAILEHPGNLGTEGKRMWTREELHER